MNKNLGKFFFLFFLGFTLVQAESFIYDMHLSKQVVYDKESLLLSVDINQTDPDPVLLFKFAVKPSDSYMVTQIDASHDYTPHHTDEHYLYLVNPLKSGEIHIGFDLTKRVTNDDKLSYFFSGDRDDFKKLETTDYVIDVPSLSLKVKPLPENIAIIGDFTLSTEIKTNKVEAYAPIPVKITLEGRGYPPLFKEIIPKELNLTVFRQKPIVNKKVTRQGIYYKIMYTLALSSDKSFTLPDILFKAFDPKTERAYELIIPKQHFEISSVNKSTLVDTVDTPAPLHRDFSWLTTLLSYLLVFSAGYISAVSIKWTRKRKTLQRSPLYDKIEQCKNEKTLLQLLMAQESKKFVSVIEKLEKRLYKKDTLSFKKLKEEALKRL
jgi:hypothetical protein